jgi:RNA polymerase sigma-70 factor (ECF subfamily)
MLREDTVRYFLFTIARNIVIDYLRRYYKKQEITSYIYDTAICSINEPEDRVAAKDILVLEKNKLQTFSTQRKKVYMLSRFEGKTPLEISKELQLSKRTIENHLLAGRKIMRAYISQCI